MIDISFLNENQKAAVLAEDQYIRIIAGAGSGKTRVLTMRIAHLIQDLQVYPNKILAITFTNKAANEMKQRIRNILHDENTTCFISTIHSLCVRILREDITSMNYPRNFTVLDADDQKSIIKEAYRELNIDKNEEYNTCDGENIAEWVYTTGALEYDTCVDKNNKLLFIDRNKALEKVKEERNIALDYIQNELDLEELSEDNYQKYYEYTKNVDESHEHYEDIMFLKNFFDVYDNNFLK